MNVVAAALSIMRRLLVRPLKARAIDAVNFPVKLLLTFLLIFLGYECMVYALDLLNRPSDRAVYEGTACLVLLLLFLPIVLWRVWRRSL